MKRMLGEVAFGDIDLAAAADAAPAADRIEIDAERARGGEQARPVGEFAALSGRGEDDAMGAQRGSLTRLPGYWAGRRTRPAPFVGEGRGWGVEPCFPRGISKRTAEKVRREPLP